MRSCFRLPKPEAQIAALCRKEDLDIQAGSLELLTCLEYCVPVGGKDSDLHKAIQKQGFLGKTSGKDFCSFVWLEQLPIKREPCFWKPTRNSTHSCLEIYVYDCPGKSTRRNAGTFFRTCTKRRNAPSGQT